MVNALVRPHSWVKGSLLDTWTLHGGNIATSSHSHFGNIAKGFEPIMVSAPQTTASVTAVVASKMESDALEAYGEYRLRVECDPA